MEENAKKKPTNSTPAPCDSGCGASDVHVPAGAASSKCDGVQHSLESQVGTVKEALAMRITSVHDELTTKIEGTEAVLATKLDKVAGDINAKIDMVKTEILTRVDDNSADIQAVRNTYWWTLKAAVAAALGALASWAAKIFGG